MLFVKSTFDKHLVDFVCLPVMSLGTFSSPQTNGLSDFFVFRWEWFQAGVLCHTTNHHNKSAVDRVETTNVL